MAIERSRSTRKASGGRYKPYRKSRQHAAVSQPTLTKLGEYKAKAHRVSGAARKIKVLSVNKINVADPASKTVKIATIKTVKQNDANINFIIRNIMNKGAVVETDLGMVRITSRPGQNGSVSGVLVK